MRLRTEVIIGALITVILGGIGVVEYRSMTRGLMPVQRTTTTSSTPSAGTAQSPSAPQHISLTIDEVAKHNTNSDCWLIMEQNVYDATNYIRLHPGGANRITPYCGKDASQAYATQGGRGSHSGAADNQKDMLKIGTLNGTTDTKTIQTVQDTTKQQAPLRGRREFDDDDD